MDTVSYALSRKYVNDTINALGAVKGAPCTIKTIDEHENYTDVVFEWTGTDGSILTDTMRIDHPIKAVTTESIKTALGYTPAKQDDVASLSADIANLTGEYELINRFTVSEDVTSLVVDRDSAGKPFELVSAILRISCGGNVVSGSSTGEIIFSSANFNTFCNFYMNEWKYPGYKISETNIRKSDAVVECDIRGGVIRTFCLYGDVGNVLTNDSYFSGNELREARNEVLVKAFVKFAVPKNAEVCLYGIRKEKADG